MNFDFSEEQQFLRGEVRKFLEAHCPPSKVRAVMDDPSRHYDAELWQALVGQGYTALAVPEAHGGMGMSLIDLCVLAEELGRVLAPVPFAPTIYLLAEALRLAGTASQMELLGGIADGSVIGCLALTEGPGELVPGAARCQVAEGKLSGTKLPVAHGMVATHALVSASDGSAVRLLLVALDQPAVSRECLQTLDPSMDQAQLTFDGAHCEPLGDTSLIERLLNGAAVLLAFEQIGGADRCLEQAVDYSKLRYAFGRPIGSQQAIKHKLADMYANNQIARSNAYYGAWALQAEDPAMAEGAAAARVSAIEAFWYAARESIQTHGGIGFTWEADQHLFYRRAMHLATVIGSGDTWRNRLIDALEAQAAKEA